MSGYCFSDGKWMNMRHDYKIKYDPETGRLYSLNTKMSGYYGDGDSYKYILSVEIKDGKKYLWTLGGHVVSHFRETTEEHIDSIYPNATIMRFGF